MTVETQTRRHPKCFLKKLARCTYGLNTQYVNTLAITTFTYYVNHIPIMIQIYELQTRRHVYNPVIVLKILKRCFGLQPPQFSKSYQGFYGCRHVDMLTPKFSKFYKGFYGRRHVDTQTRIQPCHSSQDSKEVFWAVDTQTRRHPSSQNHISAFMAVDRQTC